MTTTAKKTVKKGLAKPVAKRTEKISKAGLTYREMQVNPRVRILDMRAVLK